jgi:hypothetical protein
MPSVNGDPNTVVLSAVPSAVPSDVSSDSSDTSQKTNSVSRHAIQQATDPKNLVASAERLSDHDFTIYYNYQGLSIPVKYNNDDDVTKQVDELGTAAKNQVTSRLKAQQKLESLRIDLTVGKIFYQVRGKTEEEYTQLDDPLKKLMEKTQKFAEERLGTVIRPCGSQVGNPADKTPGAISPTISPPPSPSP